MKTPLLKIAIFTFLFILPRLAFAEDRTPVTLRINPYSIEEENKELKYTINALYPQIENEKLTVPEKRINRTIRKMVKSDVSSFKKLFEGEIPAVVATEEDKSAFNTSYKHYLSGPNGRFLSVIFEDYTYLTGTAHGETIIATLNFDRHTGREIKLNDIFKKKTNYLKKLSELSRKDILEKLGEEADTSMIDSGTEPVLENFETFAFTDKGFTIFFQQYQITSYAGGIQEVVMSYRKLKKIIRSRGPVGIILKYKKQFIF